MKNWKASAGVLLMLVGAGCGLNGTGSGGAVVTTEATVTGKVTANGSPVTKGKVTLNPPGPPFVERIADIRQDGTYEVKTYVGKNAFTVTGTNVSPAGNSYNNTTYDVKEGPNTIDLVLPLGDK